MSDTVSQAAVAGSMPQDLVASQRRGWSFLARNPTFVLGGVLLAILFIVSAAAPWIASRDPMDLNIAARLKPPSSLYWFGTDAYGRDVFSRTLYGGRVSLIVGLSVAIASGAIGVVLAMLGTILRPLDAVIMRIMDGMMAIPGVLLAIAMMALSRGSVGVVIVAITIPEVPRVVRLVRSLVLTIREQPYVEAAVASGTRLPRIMLRHILPNTVAPLIVQSTYICAAAVLIEAYLSFLGVGIPPEIPSWGNVIAEGRLYVQLAFWTILFPGLFLGIMVLAINILGDGLRDMLDPRIARRM